MDFNMDNVADDLSGFGLEDENGDAIEDEIGESEFADEDNLGDEE